MLVGCKADLKNERTVDESDIMKFKDKNKLDYIVTSSKEKLNVIDAFYNMSKAIYNKVLRGEIKFDHIPELKPKKEEGKCC